MWHNAGFVNWITFTFTSLSQKARQAVNFNFSAKIESIGFLRLQGSYKRFVQMRIDLENPWILLKL